MGNQQSQVETVDELCTQEWEKYERKVGSIKDGWELIHDDGRAVDVKSSIAGFLAHFSSLQENLFIGCDSSYISGTLHRNLVDVTVKRMEEIINFDYVNCSSKVFNNKATILRARDDTKKNRKTEMIFVMAIRITDTSKRTPGTRSTADLDSQTVHVESSMKLQLRSIKQTFNYVHQYTIGENFCNN